MESSNISDALRSLASNLLAVADEAIDLNNDESIQKIVHPLLSFLQDISALREPINDTIKGILSHQSPNESSRLQCGPAGKRDEHILRNTRDSDVAGASERRRSDKDGEASQDQRCLTIREASSLTEVRASNDAVDKTKEKHEKEGLKNFEANPWYLEFLHDWIESPETFFNKNIEVTIDHGIYRFLSAIDLSKDLNSIKRRYTLRQLYLSRRSWGRFETTQFISKLVGDAKNVGDSTIRFWIKEGELYELLCTKFGMGCLFCDIAPAKDAQTMSIPAKDKPRNPKLDEFIASLHHRNIEAVSKQYNLVATKIASHMRDKQIEAGLLRPPKRVADELSNDTPGKPLKKVCQRTSTDQPSRLMIQDSAGSSHLRQSTDPTTHYDLTYNTDQELAGTGTETVAYDDSSGGRNDGPGPQNAAVGIRDDQLSIPSPQSTSCNRLHESLEQNIIPSNPKTTAAAMSTTSTPSPASNPDAETQPGRENTLSDRLQTESQKPDAVSGALSSGPNSLPADGSPRSGHTASSHPNSEIPQEQPPFLQRPSHTDISSISAPMPDKFNSMPSQQQSSHKQQQHSQFHGDDLQTSQQSKIIGHMDMGEAVASVSTPVTEPRYFESSQNINEKSAGQKSAPIVAQDEEEQQPGSSHSELQNRDWDIQAGAEHAGNPDTCLQADTMRMHNLLNESQDSRSATESCQSGYCSGPATNDDAQAQLKRFSSQQVAERSMPGRTTTSRGATGLPTPPHMGPGQEGVSSDIRDAYDQQTASTPNTRFSHTGPTLSQHRPPNSQPASGPSANSSSWRSYTTVTRSTSPWRQASLCTPAQNLSVMRSATVDTTGCNSPESSGGMPRPEDSTSSAILLPTYDNALAPAKDSPFDGTNFRAEIYSENPKSYWDMVKEFHVETSWDRWLQGDARHSL